MLRKETSFSLLCQLYLNEKISGSYEKDYVGKHTSRQKVIKEHKLKLLKTIISEINSLNSTINEGYFFRTVSFPSPHSFFKS